MTLLFAQLERCRWGLSRQQFYPGIVVVKPFQTQKAWAIDVSFPGEAGARQAKVVRTQVPVTTVKASTLNVLQGATADPGLILHWVFPRLLRRDMRWLAIYVALSRVRRLKSLRSIGLSKDIRTIMENGPPDTLPTQFQMLFCEKEAQTALDANAAMVGLGWA